MTKKELQRVNEELKEKHYQALYEMLGGSTKVSKESMARSLRRYELSLRRRYLFLFEKDSERVRNQIADIKVKVCKYFACNFANGVSFVNNHLMFNSDARGYSLKIEWNGVDRMSMPYRNLHIDWGQYGIVAPEPDEFFT